MDSSTKFNLIRETQHGVTFLKCKRGEVTLAFTERMGGVSAPPYDSLNLGLHVGDNPKCVNTNIHKVLKALRFDAFTDKLLMPRQVHGTHVVAVTDQTDIHSKDFIADLSSGCDGLVVTRQNTPVMLVFADCVPVVITSRSGFAVVHSGWKGTLEHITAKAIQKLCACTQDDISTFSLFIGPHIRKEDYVVSFELTQRFHDEFGSIIDAWDSHLDLRACIVSDALSLGMYESQIVDCGISTFSNTSRFFSYRGEETTCGRLGAIACLTVQVSS